MGDASEDIEEAVNILEKENISVIAKEAADSRQLSSYIEDAVSKGDSHIVVMVKDPMRSSISLNKSSDINAALCSTSDDVASAYRSGANVIILKDSNEKEEVLGAIIGMPIQGTQQGGEQKQAQIAEQVQRKRKRAAKHVEEAATEEAGNEVAEEQHQEADEVEKREADGQQSGKSKGLFNDIKDALGIVSPKKEQKEEKKE